MKIAFATQDLETVDAHFGWAKNIVVYELDQDGHYLSNTFSFGENLEEDGNEDKLTPKLEMIGDCAILYVAAIGGSAAARVVAKNIFPVKVSQPESIQALLERLKQTLRGTPPPWLRKALAKGRERVLDFEDEEIEHA